MQNIAQPWLAYTLTKSPLLLSLIGALQFTPMLIFALFAGVIVDRFPKKNIIFLTQLASLIITLILVLLVWSGQIKYWHLLILATALGIVNTLDMPARQSFVIELVGREDLMNAIALNSMTFNLARIIGPAVAGLVMSFWGIGTCFLVNSISFAAVIISLFFIKPNYIQNAYKAKVNIAEQIKGGVRYILKNKTLSYAVLVLAIVGTFAPNFNVLIPVFSAEILNSGEMGFGLLMSFMGVGSFLGAMYIAISSKTGPNKLLVSAAPVVVGALLIITGYTHLFFVTGVLIGITGFFLIAFLSSVNSTLQINSSNEYRGRVMSIYTLVFAGSTPFGNLYAGWFADHFNPRIGFAACGSVIILLMIPVYLKKMKKSVRR
ncbi:Predicted arabinose efflux permease, MFS family [Parasporobacterium paucivorans DSM 15970]|uniref:Predicted arabinose efflux permease, MFS family n=2 Tax=Parasporobacterium TaxID=115543 RepID=A0A1M6CY44_9FIRM|nr:Predicted arabinose efflux permease, MFS family [Parasporobacterium paucivorans DSM 15970]